MLFYDLDTSSILVDDGSSEVVSDVSDVSSSESSSLDVLEDSSDVSSVVSSVIVRSYFDTPISSFSVTEGLLLINVVVLIICFLAVWIGGVLRG